MNTFKLTVLSANKPFYEGECESLIIPASDGLYGIQAGHRNLITAIIPGMMTMTFGGKKTVAAVSKGMLKAEDGEVLVLVDTAELPEEIDINRAKRDAAMAKEAILQKKSIRDYYTAQAKLARALNRLKVKNHDIQ